MYQSAILLPLFRGAFAIMSAILYWDNVMQTFANSIFDRSIFCFSITILLLAGCTSVDVKEVPSSAKLSHVCIENNPKVIVVDFLPVVRDGFARHGITTEVYKDTPPEYCEYRLTYTAFKTWDIATYLHHAELRLYQEHNQIGFAEYHLTGGGGLSLTKWASVESKMNPVIDELLAAYTPAYVDSYRDSSESSESKHNDDDTEKLEILKDWYEDGLIEKEEYESEKNRIIRSL
jgi:hypothetical protein